MQNNKLQAIEGLRAFAALGVVWVHVWTWFNNVPFAIYGFDIFKAISFVGCGVDFFFVISGFLMYRALYKQSFTFLNYYNFIRKRFLRIAPLYYVTLIFYYLYFNYFFTQQISVKDIFIDALFLNNFYKINIAYTYWSLGVEWWFYTLIPFIFFFEKTAYRLISLLVLCIIGFIQLISLQQQTQLFNTPDQPLPLIFEFAWGVLVGFLISSKFKITLRQNILNIAAAFIILYIGRLMRFTNVVVALREYGFWAKTLSGIVMTFGFALLMYIAITSKGKLTTFLSWKPMQFIGKLSFGIYLWHLVFVYALAFITSKNQGPLQVVLYYILVVLLTIILSWLSYEWIEKKYFQSKFSSQAKLN